MRARISDIRFPAASAFLVHIQFDGDLLSLSVTNVPKALALIEVSEKRLPGFRVT